MSMALGVGWAGLIFSPGCLCSWLPDLEILWGRESLSGSFPIREVAVRVPDCLGGC